MGSIFQISTQLTLKSGESPPPPPWVKIHLTSHKCIKCLIRIEIVLPKIKNISYIIINVIRVWDEMETYLKKILTHISHITRSLILNISVTLNIEAPSPLYQ